MRIAVIAPGTLPIPAVNGGSVEKNAMMPLLDENECAAQPLDITVFSPWNKAAEAEAAAAAYRHAHFEYVDMSTPLARFSRAVRHAFNRLPRVYAGSAYIARVIARLRRLPAFDAVLVENIPEYAIALRRHFKGRLLVHMHNDTLASLGWKAARSIASADGIVSVSRFISNRIPAPEGKRHVVYNGIRVADYAVPASRAAAQATRARYGIAPQDKVFVYAGRLNANKGVKELMEAFCLLDRRVGSKLFIMGSKGFGGTRRDAFFDALEKAAAPRRDDVIFTGYVWHEDLCRVYGACDIAVVPSLWEEPAAYTVMEAMAFELPLVATDAGGIPELYGEAAVVVPRGADFSARLARAMQSLMTDEALCADKRRLGLERVAALTTRDYYRNLVSLLRG